jgi:hypothetical protein
MEKFKKFAGSKLGMIVIVLGVIVLGVIVLVVAYSSKIPGFGWLQRLAAKLPGSDAKTGAA